MSSNLRSFNLALDRHAEVGVPERLGALHRAVALEALRGVVLMSPVDTGRFKGNWQMTTDEPARGDLDVTDKAGGATIAAGARVVEAIRPFSVSWLVNNLPYADALERGSSQQAPRGMLAVTANRLRAWLSRAK